MRILPGVFPEDTAHLLTEDRLRFCHIDVDVYESARTAFEWAWSRLVVGGVVVFDDFGLQSCPGITKLVSEQKLAADRIFNYNLSGQAILVKITPC